MINGEIEPEPLSTETDNTGVSNNLEESEVVSDPVIVTGSVVAKNKWWKKKKIIIPLIFFLITIISLGVALTYIFFLSPANKEAPTVGSVVTNQADIETKIRELFREKDYQEAYELALASKDLETLFYSLMTENNYFMVINKAGVDKSCYEVGSAILIKYERSFMNKEPDQNKLAKIKDTVIAQCKEKALINEEAKNLGIDITETELTTSFNQLIESQGGEKIFLEVLDKYYGIDKETFKNLIFRDRLIKQKTNEEFIKIDSDGKKKQAEEILARALKGENFAELAKKYSQDSTASNGGDLGYVIKGTLIPEIESLAFNLGNNEIGGPVKSVYGYHVIKVTEKTEDQVRISQIVIKIKSLETWLEEKQKSSFIILNKELGF